jgi:hypothetical protein
VTLASYSLVAARLENASMLETEDLQTLVRAIASRAGRAGATFSARHEEGSISVRSHCTAARYAAVADWDRKFERHVDAGYFDEPELRRRLGAL